MKNQRQNKFLGYLKFVPQTKKVEDKKPLPKVNEKIGKYELKQEPKVIEKKIMISEKTPKLLNKRMWMRFILTAIMFGSFYWVLWLLFTDKFTLDDKFRDLLNIIIGSFLVSFGKVVDFWFKGSHEDEDKQKN